MTAVVGVRQYQGILLSDDDSYVIPATLGSELVSNGGIVGTSPWTFDAGWSYSAGSNHAYTATSLNGVNFYQTQFLTIGDYYEINFDLATIAGTGWTLVMSCAGYTHKSISGAIQGEGSRTYKFVFRAVTGGGFLAADGLNFKAYTNGSSTFSIDNITMKHVDTTATMLDQHVDGAVFPRASGFVNYSDEQSVWWVG